MPVSRSDAARRRSRERDYREIKALIMRAGARPMCCLGSAVLAQLAPDQEIFNLQLRNSIS
jgi:hypothetical protein